MIKHKNNSPRRILFFGIFILAIFVFGSFAHFVFAEEPKPIVIEDQPESILERMERAISLDVRDMNIVDVIKFLSLKGEFNVVISPTVEGRATVLLKQVSIKDALDIVVISNKLAYKIDKNIVQIMTSSEYESMYGKSFADKREVVIFHLNYSKPTYVLAALDNIRSNIGKIIIDEDTGSVVVIDTPEAIEQMRVSIEKMEKPLETIVYTLQYAQADVVADKLRSRIDAKAVGAITPDERSNKIIVRAFPGRIQEIKDIIKNLDTPTKEVLVDARVLQIVLKPQYDVGIDWQMDLANSGVAGDLKNLSFKNFYLNQNSLASSDNLFSRYGQIAVGNVSQDAFQLAIRSLQQVSDTKILSNPQILVTNNQEASIHIGDTVPYIISTTSGTGDNAITSEDVRFVDVGLKLNVTPVINDDGFVTMRLRPEISTVVGSITSKGGGIPQVNKTAVETTVMVKDGNTIIMGGLKKDNKAHVKKGFPVLMNLPIVGALFGRTADNFEQTEIVILITPHIITGHHDDIKKMNGTIKPYKEYSTK
ncbi:MAG: hypothetical protein HQL24_01475 [Candidatus Omnitrophica bacterium]|nr:hypothetical protein [Candidatus Omnitrophota bacterium]